MTGPGSDRELVLRTAQVLWPGEVGRLVHGVRPGRPGQQWHVLPSPDRARLLVPRRPRWAAAMLDRRAGGLRSQARQRSLGLAVGGPWGALAPTWRLQVAPRPDTRVETLLGSIAGTEVGVGVRFGTPRANRKPLLQALDDQGTTRSWTKVALRPADRRRLDQEQSGLGTLAGALHRLEVPAVLGRAERAGAVLLVLSPLVSGGQPWQQWPIPWAAMTEVATVAGTARVTVGDLEGWARWRRLREEAADSAALQRLALATDAAAASLGAEQVETGHWHGDWTPWNMGYHHGRLQVWDWENFAGGRPLGFDPLHFATQGLFARRADVAAVCQALDEMRPGLAEMGVGGRAVDTTWALYLLEVAHRYLFAAGESPGAGVTRRLAWVLDQLDAAARRPTGVPGALR